MEARNTVTDHLLTHLEYFLYAVTVILAGRRGLPLVDAWIRVLTMLSIVIEVVQEKLEQRGMINPVDCGTELQEDIPGDAITPPLGAENEINWIAAGEEAAPGDINWIAAGEDAAPEERTGTGEVSFQPKSPMTSTSISRKLRLRKPVLQRRMKKHDLRA